MISTAELKRQLDVLGHQEIGYVHDHFDQWMTRLREREPWGNPLIEILQFCEATGHDREELLFELNFTLYDKLP